MKLTSILGRIRHRPFVLWCALTLMTLAIASVIAPVLTDEGVAQDLGQRLAPPVWLDSTGTGILGADQLGRDLFWRLIVGVRTSLIVSFGAVGISFILGSVVGMMAGVVRGPWESLVLFAADVQLSFPALLIAMIFVTAIGQGIGTLILVLGLSYWMIFARMARQATLTVAATEFVGAAKTFGSGTGHILRRHIFGNVLPALIGVAAVEMARIILAEAALSYLGFGLQPPTVSIGGVLADGTKYLALQWWIASFAGVVLTLLVLSINVTGTWLHKEYDPMGRLSR